MITVKLMATDGSREISFETLVSPDDQFVLDRMEQAGGDILLAGALAAVHTYDIFPERKDY